MFAATPISQAGEVETLETRSYKITIERHCEEGVVVCDDMKYVGVNKRTGKSITLSGTTAHTVGADGVTPGHFLGYSFKHGKTKYFVSPAGELEVTREAKVLIKETGKWK